MINLSITSLLLTSTIVLVIKLKEIAYRMERIKVVSKKNKAKHKTAITFKFVDILLFLLVIYNTYLEMINSSSENYVLWSRLLKGINQTQAIGITLFIVFLITLNVLDTLYVITLLNKLKGRKQYV